MSDEMEDRLRSMGEGVRVEVSEAFYGHLRGRVRRDRRRRHAVTGATAVAAVAVIAVGLIAAVGPSPVKVSVTSPPTSTSISTSPTSSTSSTTSTSPLTTTSPSSAVSTPAPPVAPAHGMPGLVQVQAAAFPTAADGVVAIEQCFPCQARSGTYHYWLAVTSNGGGSWTVQPTPGGGDWTELAFADGPDGWASTGRTVYVTHDGGITWKQVPTSNLVINSLSIAGGQVWASAVVSTNLAHGEILTGPAAGDHLSSTPAQPTAGGSGPVTAGSATEAYVYNGVVYPPASDGTTSAGRHWYPLTAACPPGHAATTGTLGADGPNLLDTCQATRLYGHIPKINPADKTELTTRSTDGGHRWTTYPDPADAASPILVSPTVAWATCRVQDVCRTTDGGQAWRRVWSPPAMSPQAVPEALGARGVMDADEVVAVSPASGTYLVVYATTDGGQRWVPTTVALPARSS